MGDAVTGISEISAPALIEILSEVARRGIVLRAEADNLRYRPRTAMTPDLARRITAHKGALLDLLRNDAIRSSDETAHKPQGMRANEVQSVVSSVVSVSEQGQGLWSEDELRLLSIAGLTPTDVPIVCEAKSIFAEDGLTVVSIEAESGRGGLLRRKAAGFIRAARQRLSSTARQRLPPLELPIALRDAWRERLAICTIDGEVPLEEAERIALKEMEEMLCR